jgi:hypothetical protein
MNHFRLNLVAVLVYALLPGSAQAVDLPSGGQVAKVDFERHVMGLLSKAGCNTGGCHGSFQGKNGFRLSLFGYEPAMDYAALTRDNLGRRVLTQNPEGSLLLLKGSGAMPHEGGMRFGRESWTYKIFKQWIDDGATWTPGSGAVKELTITPGEFAVVQGEKQLQIKVMATYADNTREDITPFCDFKITDEAVATVSPLGVVSAHQPGDVGLTVLYRGTVRALRVLVPTPSSGKAPKVEFKPVNSIDQQVLTKLKLLNMIPSGPASDLEFIRRIYIDTIGILPTPEQVRKFLGEKSANKRTELVDELLKHPLHAAMWATKLSDITGNNTVALENPVGSQVKRSQMWHDWLRKRVADNQPYDQMVRDILTATSRDAMTPEEWLEKTKKFDEQMDKGFETDYPNKPTLDLFWRRQQQVPIEQWGEKVAAAFLGVRLECAQCHKHPTDRWTQDDYWGFANLFAPVVFSTNQFSTPDAKKLADAENTKRRDALSGKPNNNQLNLVREMFFGFPTKTIALRPIPMTTRVVSPRTLGGEELPHKMGEDTRIKLMSWMKDAKNPFFAKSFVNRVWAHYFGVGLVNPVDDFSQANPPTNPRLLDLLASEFIQSGYDIRNLERMILVSRTYQQSSVPNTSNKFDKNNFARSYVRPMMAEQVVDVLNSAIGVDEQFGNDAPTGRKMIEVGSSRLNNPNLAYALRIFGRPARTTACDCERAAEPALPQTLFRMTDPTIVAKLKTGNNRPNKLAKDKALSDEQVIEDLFLGTLTRLPSAQEKADALKYIKAESTRLDALQEITWALINTREFILNH